MRGPKNATALLHADGRATGIHEIVWATPEGQVTTIEYHPYPRNVNMSNPEPLLFSLWDLLQSKVQIVMGDEAGVVAEARRAEAKYQARGIAEALAILMQPFVADADAVVRHAVKYYKDNSYPVPGLGAHLWNSMYNADGSLRTPIASEPTKRTRTAIKAPPKPKATLSAADIEFAKAGLSSNMFTLADLASMFKVSEAEVQAAVS